jgi:hypothetical protein
MRVLAVAAGGIARGFERANGAAASIARAGGPGDLATDMVTLSTAAIEVRANVAVARTAQEMQKTLVDLIA